LLHSWVQAQHPLPTRAHPEVSVLRTTSKCLLVLAVLAVLLVLLVRSVSCLVDSSAEAAVPAVPLVPPVLPVSSAEVVTRLRARPSPVSPLLLAKVLPQACLLLPTTVPSQ
jgi:hypothetical protein